MAEPWDVSPLRLAGTHTSSARDDVDGSEYSDTLCFGTNRRQHLAELSLLKLAK